MHIRQNKLAPCVGGVVTTTVLCVVVGTACNLFQQQQQQPGPAGLALDPNSVGLILVNEAGVPVRADAVFRQGAFEVRRTTRLLKTDGQSASSEVIPTLADTLSIEAFEADPSNVFKIGDSLATATLTLGKDFHGGETITFVIRKHEIIVMPPQPEPNPCTPGVNAPPVGAVVPEITVSSGASIVVDSTGITDPDDSQLDFAWEQLSGPAVTLDVTVSDKPRFIAPIVAPNQSVLLSFRVTGKDCAGQTAQVVINVRVVGPFPIAIALTPTAQSIPAGGTAPLSAAVSGGVAPYSLGWSVASTPTGSAGQFGSANLANTTWKAPGTELGTWTLQLQVTDAQGNHASATNNVTVAADCNTNGVVDSQEIASGAARDCNTNGVPDACDLRTAVDRDCNTDGVPDLCEIRANAALDCNTNRVLDRCELAVGALHDCDHNGVIDECDPNGPPDCPVIYCNPANGDCNRNGIWDACDILLGTSFDFNHNGIPDECEGGG